MTDRDVLDELRGFCNGKTPTVYTRAVAEIERLRAEAKELRDKFDEGNRDAQRDYDEIRQLREALDELYDQCRHRDE